MNQATWINVQAKKAALTMATLAAGALAAFSFSSSAHAYPGAPAPFDEVLLLKASCRLQAPEGQTRVGLVESVGLTADPACERQKPRLVLISQWMRPKKGETLAGILAKTPARHTYTDYDGRGGWYLTYRVEILNPDGTQITLPLSEIEHDRAMRLLPLMSEHRPLQATLTHVSNKLGELTVTPNPETQKTLPIVATCTTKQNTVHTYTSRISKTAEHLTAQESCPDGSQLTLKKTEYSTDSTDWEFSRLTDSLYHYQNKVRSFFKMHYVMSVSSKFGVELTSFATNASTWNAYVQALKTASEKHPVLLHYDIEKNVVLDLKAQADPRQF